MSHAGPCICKQFFLYLQKKKIEKIERLIEKK